MLSTHSESQHFLSSASPAKIEQYFHLIFLVHFLIGRCLHPCWSGVQWERPEWKAFVECLCQHEGLAVWDNTFVHRDHCFFQHQHQCLGGPVSRTQFSFYNVSIRFCQQNQDPRLSRSTRGRICQFSVCASFLMFCCCALRNRLLGYWVREIY